MNFRLFRFFNLSSQNFYLFKVKICKSIWIYWSCYYFRNVHHSTVWNTRRVLLGRIFVSSVPRNLQT